MNQNHLKKWTRLILALCGCALIVLLFVPLWRIDLAAPQYPEGLTLLIFPNRLGGNVDIINGLNHYIGMKSLHTADFIEFTVLPYIFILFSLLILISGITGARRLFNITVILFVCFGIISMVDFWRWEYNYGHHLNPDAAIIVPGMAYQPPLVGYKQLLNFSAYSMPATGGWLFAGVGVTLLLLTITEWMSLKKRNLRINRSAGVALGLVVFLFTSCTPASEKIIPGKDHCDFCKMTVSDNRFGAEIVTKKGKIFKFDDAHCVLSFLKDGQFDSKLAKDIYFTDFSNTHSLIKTGKAFFLKSDELKSPMGGNVAAFSDRDSLNKMTTVYKGTIVTWNDLFPQ